MPTANLSSGPIIVIATGASAQEIQDAVDAAPAHATIQLSAGSYSFSQTVVVDRDGITIAGASAGTTTILTQSSMGTAPAFQLGSPLFIEDIGVPALMARASAGATSLRLTDAHDFQVGDVVWIAADNDAALFQQIGDHLWQENKPLRTTMATITEVQGLTITLDRPLPREFPAGTALASIETADGLCLRDLTIRGAYSPSDPGDFTNRRPDASGAMMVVANATTGLRLEGVVIDQPASHGLVIGKSLDPIVVGLCVTGAQNKGDGGNGYGVMIRDVYDGAFRDLSLIDMRHAVLFASYTSASGNSVHVAFTNRDINFHGGLDLDNAVVVERSIRTPLEAAYLGAVSFVNPGTSYGAPTDPSANSMTFGEVAGTVRADLIQAWDSGARIETFGGMDTVTGGRGSDYLDVGTGDDRIVASDGADTIVGGFGRDTLVVNSASGTRIVTESEGKLLLLSFEGRALLSGVESLRFLDRSITVPDGSVASVLTPMASGTTGYDRIICAGSIVMGASVEAVTLTGTASASVLGNGLNNNVIGNEGANFMMMGAGDDRCFGGLGNDSLSGGDGNDFLHGGSGDDALDGGAGVDTLSGRQGADRFFASGGTNYVTDFSTDQGDTFIFAGTDLADIAAAVELWLDTGSNAAGFAIGVVQFDGRNGLSITDADGDNLVLVGVTPQQFIADYGDL